MKTYLMADPVRYPAMTTAQIRETFLIDSLHVPGTLTQAYVDLDRAISICEEAVLAERWKEPCEAFAGDSGSRSRLARRG